MLNHRRQRLRFAVNVTASKQSSLKEECATFSTRFSILRRQSPIAICAVDLADRKKTSAIRT
jgi:hypothetical protein